MEPKSLGNTDANGTTKNVPDVVFFGDGDTFKLISKASSQDQGWMKSTKAMQIDGVGCVVQVTTQQRNPDGSSSVAEAVTFVPGVEIVATVAMDQEEGAVCTGRRLQAIGKHTSRIETQLSDATFKPATSLGTGALETSDAAAEAVTKGERVTIDQLRDQIAGVFFTNGALAHNCAAFSGSPGLMIEESRPFEVMDALACLTICVLVLKNGFTVVGKSACADPANFNAELGQKLARDDAERQAWAFLGFRLRDKLAG